jgi:hypothetical protein
MSSLTEPACLSCKRAWSRPFLDEHLTPTWISGPLHEHRGDVLFDRERSLLPDTQEAVAMERRKREAAAELKVLKAQQIPLLSAVQEAKAAVNAAVFLPVGTPAEKKLAAAQRKASKSAHRAALAALRAFEKDPRWAAFYHMMRTGQPLGGAVAAPAVAQRAKFIAACPRGDCRGFLSSQYKCGTCDGQFCSKCREQKAEGHECDPDLVATIAAIVADSRPCPSCATPISRVSGCDQMWCTECRTPFSYATGQRVAGVIHNPHYFQQMAAIAAAAAAAGGNGAAAGGNGAAADEAAAPACGEAMVDARMDDILFYLHHNRELLDELYSKISDIRYCFADLRYRVLREDRLAEDNTDLRVAFLLQDIDEAALKKELSKRQREIDFQGEIRAVLETALGCMLDCFLAMPVAWSGVLTDYSTPVEELDAKREPLINGPLQEISVRYGRGTPMFVDKEKYWGGMSYWQIGKQGPKTTVAAKRKEKEKEKEKEKAAAGAAPAAAGGGK